MWIQTFKPPSLKCDLISWITNAFPKDKKAKFVKMKKKQLYAIWYSYHRKNKMGGHEW